MDDTGDEDSWVGMNLLPVAVDRCSTRVTAFSQSDLSYEHLFVSLYMFPVMPKMLRNRTTRSDGSPSTSTMTAVCENPVRFDVSILCTYVGDGFCFMVYLG